MLTKQLLSWALDLAERGWQVFPLQPGTKRPALHGHRTCPGAGICRDGHQGWEQRATANPDRIRACWSAAPYNIGLATGPSQLLVVDLDQPGHGTKLHDRWSTLGIRTGADVFATLARRAGEELPETYTVTTPSGGTHLYFQTPATVELRNTAGELGPLVDTRGGGGYVVAPGSVLPEGGYELHDDTEPAELPGWLVQALTPKPSQALSEPVEITRTKHSTYVAAALRAEAEHVAAARSGQQNKTLFTAALALGRLVAGGEVDETTVRHTLHRAMSRLPATRPHEPWTPHQIDNTIDSALRAAASRPRRLGTGTDEEAA